MKMDHPELFKTDLITDCPHNYYKIGMMIDPNEDYHFIRQDNNGYWSHKPGGGNVTNKDYSGMRITNPEKANFDNTSANLYYDTYCGYYCVDESANHFTESVAEQLNDNGIDQHKTKY